jgi:Putative beta-lactamase-inhibitor-like, PepSY-like
LTVISHVPAESARRARNGRLELVYVLPADLLCGNLRNLRHDELEVSMSTRRFNGSVGCLLIVVLVGLLLPQSAASAQDKNKLDLDKIPKKVMDTLKAKFPKAEIDKWTKEKDGDVVIYDIEFKQESRKFEADIKEDGTIHNWEKEVAAKYLPEAVKKAVEKKYPKSTPKEIMEITAVKNGKDELEGYEIVLETADKKKEVEVTVAPDGKIVEDSGDEK